MKVSSMSRMYFDRNSKPKDSEIMMRPLEAEALSFLLPLSTDYPGIEQWFSTKVVPGLRDESRTLLRVERQGELVGLGIAKKEHNERKICTVRVAPSHVGRGIGVRIFDSLLKWLDEDKPLLTVNDNKLPIFERIFDYYGFNLTSHIKGLYLPSSVELGFNECKSKNKNQILSNKSFFVQTADG